MEYVGSLREGILEAYTGIVTGFKNTENGQSGYLFLECESELTHFVRSATAAAVRAVHSGIGPAMPIRFRADGLVRQTCAGARG